MESYRHALYRYSTGQGFNPNVDVPEKVESVTSYKLKPLLTRMNMNSDFSVDLRREADRISMQIETAQRIMKNIGYDEQVGKDFKNLKTYLEVMQHLITKHSVRYLRVGDLEKLYAAYAAEAPDFEAQVAQVVVDNKFTTGIHPNAGTGFHIKKSYPLFDQYGKRLKLPNEELFLKTKLNKEGLSGLGEENRKNRWLLLLLVGAVTLAILKSR